MEGRFDHANPDPPSVRLPITNVVCAVFLTRNVTSVLSPTGVAGTAYVLDTGFSAPGRSTTSNWTCANAGTQKAHAINNARLMRPPRATRRRGHRELHTGIRRSTPPASARPCAQHCQSCVEAAL